MDRVYQIMVAPPFPLEGDWIKALESGPWEALAYLDPGSLSDSNAVRKTADELLQEAVPDVYHFSNGLLRLEPFSGTPSPPAAAPIEVFYALQDRILVLTGTQNGPERDRWTIHYLDAHYLVLDMGDLRLFLTHLP